MHSPYCVNAEASMRSGILNIMIYSGILPMKVSSVVQAWIVSALSEYIRKP